MTRTYKRSVWFNGQTTHGKWKRNASRSLRRLKTISDDDHIEPTKKDASKFNKRISPKEAIYGAFIKKKTFYRELEEIEFRKRHTHIYTIGRELPHKKHYPKYVDKHTIAAQYF